MREFKDLPPSKKIYMLLVIVFMAIAGFSMFNNDKNMELSALSFAIYFRIAAGDDLA